MLITGLSILIIGDSHLSKPDRLINSLHSELMNQGAAVHTFGVCGSRPSDWLTAYAAFPCDGYDGVYGADRTGKGPVKVLGKATTTIPVKTLIANEKPNLVVIVLGDTTNGYDAKEFPKLWAWQEITSLTKEIASTKTPCVWVGPAWGGLDGQNKFKKNKARVEEMSRFLSKNVAPCIFIDSTTMAKPGEWVTVDGQHLTAQGYKFWGEAIVNSLKKIELPK